MDVAIQSEAEEGRANQTGLIEEVFDDTTLAETVRVLLPKLISEYRAFASKPAPEEHKAFATFHSACRAALNHLILLEKYIDGGREREIPQAEEFPNGIDTLLTRAQEVLARHPAATE